MTSPELQEALRALLRDKVHLRPGTLARLPSAQVERLSSPMALARILLEPLGRFPLPLLDFWARHPRGHAVIGPQRHGYAPGLQAVGRRQLDGVAWVSAGRLLSDPELATPITHLLDHLLGSDGDPQGAWLSDGAGRTDAWADVARRLQRQYGLGYAPPQEVTSPHTYFSWGLRAYLARRQELNVLDPGLERLLRTTLVNPSFWEHAG